MGMRKHSLSQLFVIPKYSASFLQEIRLEAQKSMFSSSCNLYSLKKGDDLFFSSFVSPSYESILTMLVFILNRCIK